MFNNINWLSNKRLEIDELRTIKTQPEVCFDFCHLPPPPNLDSGTILLCQKCLPMSIWVNESDDHKRYVLFLQIIEQIWQPFLQVFLLGSKIKYQNI